jgi:hypothetical protein
MTNLQPVDPSVPVAPMPARFMASDRAFAKAPRAAHQDKADGAPLLTMRTVHQALLRLSGGVASKRYHPARRACIGSVPRWTHSGA